MSNEQQPKPFVVGHIDMGFNAEKVLELAQEFSEQQPMTAEQMAAKVESTPLSGIDPMSENRMAEIVERVATAPLLRAKFGTDGAVSLSHDYERDVRSLLAEVQRLKVDNERLRTWETNFWNLEKLREYQQGEIKRLERQRIQAEVERMERWEYVRGVNDILKAEITQLRQQLREAVEVLEWYGDENEEDVYRETGYAHGNSDVQQDQGGRARAALSILKGDRTDG